jgi:WD40 repeat protein
MLRPSESQLPLLLLVASRVPKEIELLHPYLFLGFLSRPWTSYWVEDGEAAVGVWWAGTKRIVVSASHIDIAQGPLRKYFGFGDLVFRGDEGAEIMRWRRLRAVEQVRERVRNAGKSGERFPPLNLHRNGVSQHARPNTFTDGPAPLNAVAWDPNNHWIATGGADGIVRLWDARTAKQLMPLGGHAGQVRSVAVSPDGSWIAATTGKSGEPRNHATGGPITVWETSTGHRRPFTLFGNAVAIHPAGDWIAVAKDDGSVHLHHPNSGETLLRLLTKFSFCRLLKGSLNGENARSYAVAVDDSGRWLTASSYQSIFVWDTHTTEISLHRCNIREIDDTRCLAIHPTGYCIIHSHCGGTIEITRISDHRATRLTHFGYSAQIAISPTGKWFLAEPESEAGRLCVLDVESGAVLHPTDSTCGLHGRVLIAPNGSWFASASFDSNTIDVIDPETGHKLHQLLGHKSTITALASSPDSRYLVSVDLSGEIFAWDISSGLPKPNFPVSRLAPIHFAETQDPGQRLQ